MKPDRPPLVVDLDGTLVRGDTLFETIAANLFSRPLQTLSAMAAIFSGRAALKRRLAEVGLPDIASLPLNESFIAFLREEKAKGRSLHLATAADRRIADAVAARLELFDSVAASEAGVNLKGARKRDALEQRFPGGFSYAGDSRADLAVWAGAKGAVIVGARPGVAAAARANGVPVEAEFPPAQSASFKVWRKAFRLHQWAKNILIFAPILLAHAYGDEAAVLRVVLGFFILGVVASGTYLVNDLADLGADRRHRTKHRRPFASGAIPVELGLAAAPTMIAGGLAAGFAVSPMFGLTLVIYLVLTLAYSFGLKRVAMLDVLVLGALYSLRLLMGVALVGSGVSPWLIAFSFFFFYSMSLAKRHVELVNAGDAPTNVNLPGRGYRPADWPLTLAMGAASTAASIVVIVLYLSEEAFPSGVYGAPGWLWAAPVIVTLWTQRIWLLAQRGELDDDPVAFAVRDRLSLALGALLALFFAAATFL